MSNDLDELMSLDPLDMTKDNIDAIIQYHRNARARAQEKAKTGGKRGAKALLDTVAKPKVDLRALGLIKDEPKPTINRRA